MLFPSKHKKHCYTKRIKYYLKRNMLEFESENHIHCVRMTRKKDTQHYTMLKSKTKQAEHRNKSIEKIHFQSFFKVIKII